MARKKNMKKKAKRRLMFFGTLSCFMIAYFIFSTTLAITKITNLANDKKNLEQELQLLKKDENDLNIEIEKLKDPDYLARYARENYLYSKDGEYIIKIDEDNKKTEDNKKVSLDDYKSFLIGGGIFIFVIFVWIIKKVNEK